MPEVYFRCSSADRMLPNLCTAEVEDLTDAREHDEEHENELAIVQKEFDPHVVFRIERGAGDDLLSRRRSSWDPALGSPQRSRPPSRSIFSPA